MTPETARDRLRYLSEQMRRAHKAQDYRERNRLGDEHDRLALANPQALTMREHGWGGLR